MLCIENTVNEEHITQHFKNVRAIRNTPEEVLKPFKEQLIDSFKNKSLDQVNIWASKQAYLAMGNLLTVCASEKIDACPMEGFIPEKYGEILKLNKHKLTAVLVLPIGYRAGDDMFASLKKVRRSIKETVITI